MVSGGGLAAIGDDRAVTRSSRVFDVFGFARVLAYHSQQNQGRCAFFSWESSFTRSRGASIVIRIPRGTDAHSDPEARGVFFRGPHSAS